MLSTCILILFIVTKGLGFVVGRDQNSARGDCILWTRKVKTSSNIIDGAHVSDCTYLIDWGHRLGLISDLIGPWRRAFQKHNGTNEGHPRDLVSDPWWLENAEWWVSRPRSVTTDHWNKTRSCEAGSYRSDRSDETAIPAPLASGGRR